MTNKDIQSALSHLIKYEEMKNLIEEYGNPDFGKYEFPYKSLIKYIIFQQLSLQSAGAIYKRFLRNIWTVSYGKRMRKLAKAFKP